MKSKHFALAGALILAPGVLWGQEEPVELEAFIAEEVPIEESILPTSRPFDSVYGTARSILDTPRNVTIISREQLDAISIKTPRDFARLTSSSYTKSNFGAPTSPNLRGQEADLFVNGIRKGLTSNGNGLPINFNAVESVNIVKGPAGAVYGTSNYLGGYADLITKRPYFDQFRGSADLTIGTYAEHTWQADFGGPLSDTMAYRISYSGEESNGYYQFGKRNTQAIYGAITIRPSENYEIFAAAEFFVADYTENWGINRPTQALIDDGLYIPNIGTDAEYAAYIELLGNGNGVFGGGTPGVDYASIFGGAGFATIVPLDLANPVQLDRRIRLLAPGDDSFGRNFWWQVIQKLTLSETMRIENNTYFQWIDRSTFSSYHYSELLRDNWSFDNRTQFVYEGEMLDVNTGIRFRYQDVWSVNHFFNEPVNFWDLTRPVEGTNRRIPEQGFINNNDPFVPGEDGRGVLSRWYYGGTGGETDGILIGPFVQLTYRPTERIIIDAGFGVDYVDAEEVHPVLGASGIADITGDGVPEEGYSIEDDVTLETYSGSVTYKVNDMASIYATYGYSESHPVDTGGRYNVGSFDTPQESELIEIGAKLALLDETLFVGAAIFDREFVTTNPDNTTDDVFVEGFEVEFNYQPNRKFYATFGYSYIESERTAGFFATGYTADRANETGGLYITPTFPSPADPEQLFQFPGNPEHQITALASYTFDNNFGIISNLVVTGPMNLGYEGFPITVFNPDPNGGLGENYQLIANTPEIPWQYEIDVTVFYTYKSWEFNVTVFNVTDEENWDAPNAGYGNGSVVAREPVRAEFGVTYNF